jgi:hypothetical protein
MNRSGRAFEFPQIFTGGKLERASWHPDPIFFAGGICGPPALVSGRRFLAAAPSTVLASLMGSKRKANAADMATAKPMVAIAAADGCPLTTELVGIHVLARVEP